MNEHGQRVVQQVPLCAFHVKGKKGDIIHKDFSARDFWEINSAKTKINLQLLDFQSGKETNKKITVAIQVLYRRKI